MLTVIDFMVAHGWRPALLAEAFGGAGRADCALVADTVASTRDELACDSDAADDMAGLGALFLDDV